MYLTYIPTFWQSLNSDVYWRFQTSEPVVYLTFDDGPIPAVTPWVLEQLAAHDAKATFFMVGENAQRYPELYREVISQGHAVGNHTFHHLNGRKTDTQTYKDDVEQCSQFVQSKLFRPPYGRMTRAQKKHICSAYACIYWDVLSGDFDTKKTADQCFRSVKRHTKPGSIVVMHDSLKAMPRLRGLLPDVLQYGKDQGWQFKAITAEMIDK